MQSNNDLIFDLASSLGPYDSLKVTEDTITLIQREKVSAEDLPTALGRAKPGDRMEVRRGVGDDFLVEITRIWPITPPAAPQ